MPADRTPRGDLHPFRGVGVADVEVAHPARSSVATDEGIWLEDDAGEKVAVATVVNSALSHTDCTLEGSLERGDYWIVIQCRYLNKPNLIRCRRRLRVV